jgi:hypothetical protein
MRCNYLGCFCVHSVPFVHRVLARTHPILTTGVTAHTGHTVTKSAWRLLRCSHGHADTVQTVPATATDIDFYDA